MPKKKTQENISSNSDFLPVWGRFPQKHENACKTHLVINLSTNFNKTPEVRSQLIFEVTHWLYAPRAHRGKHLLSRSFNIYCMPTKFRHWPSLKKGLSC